MRFEIVITVERDGQDVECVCTFESVRGHVELMDSYNQDTSDEITLTDNEEHRAYGKAIDHCAGNQ